jgi:hypothetical protein
MGVGLLRADAGLWDSGTHAAGGTSAGQVLPFINEAYTMKMRAAEAMVALEASVRDGGLGTIAGLKRSPRRIYADPQGCRDCKKLTVNVVLNRLLGT